MANCIQALIPSPEGLYLCIWNEKIRTSHIDLFSAEVIFGTVALERLSKRELVDGGVYEPAYDIWNALVQNKRTIRKPIIFNLFDKAVEFDGQHIPLNDDPNEIMRGVESLGDVYYG